jgi:hypothetical protein
MSFGKIILYAFLIWFLYTLITKFIIPIYRTTREVKKKFREMRQTMEDQQRQQQGAQNPFSSSNAPKSQPKESTGDYIDFEEIK